MRPRPHPEGGGPVLLVDIGNTRTDLGLGGAGRVRRIGSLETGRSTRRRMGAALREALAGERAVSRAVLASVAPAVNEEWDRAVDAVCGCPRLWVDHRVELGIAISYPRPETIGVDRLANACAAAMRFGAPVIAADFGTAATFDVVVPRRGFVGGVIAPGLSMMLDGLADGTAKLPRIALGPVSRMVGRSTEEAMRIGARHGYVGLVREILHGLVDEVGAGGVTVCATGGCAEWVVKRLKENVRLAPDLTLQGLARIGELNRGLSAPPHSRIGAGA